MKENWSQIEVVVCTEQVGVVLDVIRVQLYDSSCLLAIPGSFRFLKRKAWSSTKHPSIATPDCPFLYFIQEKGLRTAPGGSWQSGCTHQSLGGDHPDGWWDANS